MNETLSIREVARLCGVSPSSIAYHVSRGKISTSKRTIVGIPKSHLPKIKELLKKNRERREESRA